MLSSIIDDGEVKAVLPAEMYESYGTVRFVNEFPLIIDALLSGGTLVMDEFDASIHPMALMNIINIFHNDDINIHHAQLIFNTHNPIFLNANLFRRDEIKFVERDEHTHISEHYSLADFKTFGEHGVRKGEDYPAVLHPRAPDWSLTSRALFVVFTAFLLAVVLRRFGFGSPPTQNETEDKECSTEKAAMR